MIQVWSRRTWLCLIIIPLRKYKINLINIFEDILELLQHKCTFSWLPCEQEKILSLSQTQNMELLSNFTSVMERTAASISLSLYFFKPYVLITLYLQLSLPLQSPICHHLFSSFVTTPVLRCTLTEYYNVSSRGWKRVIKPPSSCSSFVQ